MSSGKNKHRTKGKTLALSDFLGDKTNAPHGYTVCNIDWAEAMEKEELDDKTDMKQLVLPTAPKAARGLDIDMDDIPNKPPYTAYVGNLPYEVTEEDITRFFRDLKVSSVRIPRESGDKGRIRGFGYAEFADRQSLIQALEKNNESMKNRSIKVSLATEHNKDDGERKDERSDRTVGDWRAGPREDSFQGSRGERSRNDGYDRGMNDREPYQGRSSYSNGRFERSDRGNSNDREFERGFSGDWGGERRQGGDRYGGRDSYGDRDRDRYRDQDRGYDDRDRGYDRRNRGGGGGRREFFGGYRDDRRGDEPRDQFERRSDSRDESDAPKERPKLNLKPRTVSKAATDSANTASSSIFGGAKPVDTAAREREIEDRLAKEREKQEGSLGDRKIESGQRRIGPSRSRQSSESGPPSNFRNSLSEDDTLPPPKTTPKNDDRQTNVRVQQRNSAWGGDKDGNRDSRPPSGQRRVSDSDSTPNSEDPASSVGHDDDDLPVALVADHDHSNIAHEDSHSHGKSQHTNGSLPRESAARRARHEGSERILDAPAPVEYQNKYSQLSADEDDMHEGSASD